MGRITRRQFLLRGGVLAGALVVGGTTAALTPSGGQAEAVALTDARRRTYTALMETVVTGPSLRLDPGVAPEAAEQFATAYAAWPPDRRRDADAVLDALEQAPPGGSFSALDRASRGADLRARGRVTRATPADAERARLELTGRALELAAVVLGPPDSGHQIVTV
jgi:hypothetical protein